MSLELVKHRFSAITAALLIRGDPIAQKLLVAWTLYRPTFKDSPFKSKEDEAAALARYWFEVGALDYKRLGQIAGMPETKAAKMFKRMQAALLLWPDGTVAGQAQNVLIAESRSYLRGLGLLPRAPISEPPKKPEPQKPTEDPDAGKRDDKKNKKPDRAHRSAQALGQEARP